MTYVYNDGGRAASGFKGSTGDCVIRAVAIAAHLPYTEVYDTISRLQRSQRKTKRLQKGYRSVRNGTYAKRKWFKDYMVSLGFEWVPTMKIGSGCKVHLCSEELPMGKLVAMVSRHACAVIDGVIHDTYDPRREESFSFEPDRGQPLKENQGRNENGVWTRVGGRCVYGYWRLKD